MGREEGSATATWATETSDANTLSEAQARPHSKELSSPQVPRLRNPDSCDLLKEENHGEGRSLPGWAEGGARGRSGVSEMFCSLRWAPHCIPSKRTRWRTLNR